MEMAGMSLRRCIPVLTTTQAKECQSSKYYRTKEKTSLPIVVPTLLKSLNDIMVTVLILWVVRHCWSLSIVVSFTSWLWSHHDCCVWVWPLSSDCIHVVVVHCLAEYGRCAAIHKVYISHLLATIHRCWSLSIMVGFASASSIVVVQCHDRGHGCQVIMVAL